MARRIVPTGSPPFPTPGAQPSDAVRGMTPGPFPMTDRAWRHGGAFLLAGLFLIGQPGLSGLDGVLFHSAGRPTQTAPVHVESPRAANHAAHCLLGYTPSAAGVAPVMPARTRVVSSFRAGTMTPARTTAMIASVEIRNARPCVRSVISRHPTSKIDRRRAFIARPPRETDPTVPAARG